MVSLRCPLFNQPVRFMMKIETTNTSGVHVGAVRLEHQFYAIGQACANACDIALSEGLVLQDVPYGPLRKRLLEQGVILDASEVGAPWFPEDEA